MKWPKCASFVLEIKKIKAGVEHVKEEQKSSIFDLQSVNILGYVEENERQFLSVDLSLLNVGIL